MIERILFSMKHKLSVYLNDELVRQQGQYNDGIVLDKVKEIGLGSGEQPGEKGFPFISLIPESLAQVVYSNHVKDQEFNVSVGIIVDDLNAATAERKLWRMMRAVENVLETRLIDNDPVIFYQTDTMNFNASLFRAGDEQNKIKVGIVSVTVKARSDMRRNALNDFIALIDTWICARFKFAVR